MNGVGLFAKISAAVVTSRLCKNICEQPNTEGRVQIGKHLRTKQQWLRDLSEDKRNDIMDEYGLGERD